MWADVRRTSAIAITSLAYMVGGYLVTGLSASDHLFPAVVYALLIVVPLAHVDHSVLHWLFGGGGRPRLSMAEERTPRNLFQERL